MTRDVVEASRVGPGQPAGAQGPNRLGCTIVRPGGGGLYPSLWTRDFVLSVESGCITLPETRDTLEILARTQCLDTRRLPSGSVVPRGAIADHVTLRGDPIFFPGTYEPTEQGGIFGSLPCLDDQFLFVVLLWHAAMRAGWSEAPRHEVLGVTLLERARLAFAMAPHDGATGLVRTTASSWGISFGFTDTVRHTGSLLFASLLRAEAARCLADLLDAEGLHEEASTSRETCAAIGDAVPRVLADERTGLLRAADGLSGQPDLWGTAYALSRGLVGGGHAEQLRRAVLRAVMEGGACVEGQVRHVPPAADFSADQAWEAPILPYRKGTYQHGAFWATPLGWVVDAVAPVDARCARGLLGDLVEHLRREDFRRHGGEGAPWECINPALGYRQNGVSMASVAAVLPAARRLRGWPGQPSRRQG